MKHLLFAAFVFLALCACSSPTPEEMASLAAKGYYEHLLKGEYDKFLEGKAGSDSLPEAYRAQLLEGYKQFVAQQNSLHNGIHDIRIVNARRDTAGRLEYLSYIGTETPTVTARYADGEPRTFSAQKVGGNDSYSTIDVSPDRFKAAGATLIG